MKRLLILACLILATWAASPEAQPTRFVYLSPIDGTGTDSDPFRSRGESEQLTGRGCIDLRPRGFNRYICASNVLPANMTGVQQLGAALNGTITPARKLALEAIIGSPLSGDTPRGLIVEIIQGHLRAGRDGKLKIWLGESTPEYEAVYAYYSENSPTVVALNYLSSYGTFTRLNYTWKQTDISLDYYQDLAVVEIDPSKVQGLVDKYDEVDGVYPVKDVLEDSLDGGK